MQISAARGVYFMVFVYYVEVRHSNIQHPQIKTPLVVKRWHCNNTCQPPHNKGNIISWGISLISLQPMNICSMIIQVQMSNSEGKHSRWQCVEITEKRGRKDGSKKKSELCCFLFTWDWYKTFSIWDMDMETTKLFQWKFTTHTHNCASDSFTPGLNVSVVPNCTRLKKKGNPEHSSIPSLLWQKR